MNDIREPEGSLWWFACRICKRAFSEATRLRSHTREVHRSTSAAYGLMLSETPDLDPTITIKPCSSNLRVQAPALAASGEVDAKEPSRANQIKKPAVDKQLAREITRKLLYDCSFCDKTYPSHKSLNTHIQNVHSSTEI